MQKVRTMKHILNDILKVAEGLIEMTEHFNQDPFANGVEWLGMDEGCISGWKFVETRKMELAELKAEITYRKKATKRERNYKK